MSITLSDDQLMVQRTVRDFVAREIAPYSAQWDEAGEFPPSVMSKLGELGILGLTYPPEFGGSGGDTLSLVLALEELSKVDSSVAITVEVNTSLSGPLLRGFGTDAQKNRWLTPLLQGYTLGSFGLTEPDAGSDARGITTRAELTDGHWTINGAKSYITNSGTSISDFIIVAAVTGANEDGKKEISNIVVPKDTPGLTVGPGYKKIGWRASDTHPLFLEDCHVSEENLLGERGRGLAQFMAVLDGGRVTISAMAVGLADACLQMSLAHAQQRKAFGKLLSKHQAIQFKLADMAVSVHMSRLATYSAASLIDQGLPHKKEAAIAKLFSTEAALKVVDEAVQIHGGQGFIEDSTVARFYRDAKVLTIGEGTSEVQRMVIARELGC